MPTVHLSLPDKVYRELKKKAAELGIQVTDLIKLYIRNGLDYGLAGPPQASSSDDDVRLLAKKVEELEKQVRALSISVRGRLRQLEDMFAYVNERVDVLEDMIIKMKQRHVILAADE